MAALPGVKSGGGKARPNEVPHGEAPLLRCPRDRDWIHDNDCRKGPTAIRIAGRSRLILRIDTR